jgi:hypothetical protein
MNNRREFFNQIIGQVGVLRDDIRGVEMIPLNRLKELPDDIIQNIKPVFFPDEFWYLEDKCLCISGRNSEKKIAFELTELEIKILEYFKKGMKLIDVAKEIHKGFDSPFDEVYQIVISLFFNLASNRICHPSEIYRVDEIIKSRL